MEKIRAIERRAMGAQKPQQGLVALMEYLTHRDIRKGICTRNFEYVRTVSHVTADQEQKEKAVDLETKVIGYDLLISNI
jgi:hypothetical protein